MPAVPKPTLFQLNTDSFPNNNLGEITPADLRDFNTSMITSLVDEIPYGTFTASVDNSISALNTFTASGYPSYTALNSFTASQLTINTGYNSFTQSANYSIGALNLQTASFNTWTASINQIQSNGIVQGTATRFNLVGPGTFFSASVVQNVNGAIATLTFTSDNAKLNTSSFNDYTASNAASQSIFSASVATSFSSSNATFTAFSASQNRFNQSATASIVQLLDFSASLDATYATDAQLNYSASILQANIDTKLNTSSFNSYTQSFSQSVATSFSASAASLVAYSSSQATINSGYNSYTASNNTKWNTIGLLTGSYATTGSNVFTGSQTITGSVYGNIISASIVSSTASLDLSKGNFFTLTLVSGSTTNLTTTNIKAGQTINLLVTQPSVGFGSLSYNTAIAFPQFNIYSPTTQSGSVDIVTFVTFDTAKIYATAVKNLV
jgi:hypothetical protein